MKSNLPERWRLPRLLFCMLLAVVTVRADAIRVDLAQTNGGWQLLRAGEPAFIKGAGGSASMALLKELGGNSVRTWSVDNLQTTLKEAEKLGLTVCVGIWLPHEHGGDNFSYSNPDMVKQQLEKVRQCVLKFKDSPAVLLWGLGNEMEGADGSKVEIWNAINDAAKLTKQLDPNHPTMTVIAEMGGQKITNIHKYCPDIDIIGINSYGGGPTVAARYAGLHGVKPYILTEFGPCGPWELAKTAWGAAYEPTSTEKADWYRKTYLGSVAQKPLCLGAYAFLWGQKQETTATWFGMFLKDGTKVQAVDTMSELWTGQRPAKGCPAIKQLKLRDKNEVNSGDTLTADLEVADPNGGTLRVRWLVQPEQPNKLSGGATENQLPELNTLILESDFSHAVVHAPELPGGYRLFVYIHNESGAAVANVPFHVLNKSALRQGTAPLHGIFSGEERHKT